MATLNIPSEAKPQVTAQIKLLEKLRTERILGTEEDEAIAEAIVKVWAANMNRCLSEAELKCLGNYLKSNCKAQVDDFDKVLFGWTMRGEDETKDVVDAIQSLVNSNRESIEKLLSRFDNSQTKIISLVEKPGPIRPRKWPPSLRPSEYEFSFLSSHLRSKTSKESKKISNIFEELIALQKLNGAGTTHESWAVEANIWEGTLDEILRICKLTIEDLIPFTPHLNTTKVMKKFVEDMDSDLPCPLKLFVSSLDVVELIARISVYLSYFNEG